MSSTITALTSGGGLAMAGDTSGQLELKTNNGTTAVTVDTSQNVGIGTGSPASLLDVRNGTGSVVTLGKTSAFAGGQSSYIKFQEGSTQLADIGWVADTNEVRINNRIAGPTTFYTSNAERMRIPSDGGIRVAMESYASAPSSTNYGVSINNTGSGSRFFGQGTGTETQIEFGNRNGTRGSIQTNSTNTLYNTTSDYRLKEAVAPMTGALNTVSALKPCTYTWKVDGSQGQGFIAHELAEVVPDCVSGEKDAVDENGDIKPQCIDTSFLVATLTAAIQELNAKVDAQAAEIQALKGVA